MTSSLIPAGVTAVLPVTYERAKTAMAECERIDECMDWANKAEALASYAKQAEDNTMRQLADRIQARAIRRCGELLRAFHSEGGRPSKTSTGTDTSFPSSQREAASQAGMSKRQEVTAVRVSNVPAETFEAAVESDEPPTVTKLAEMGTRPRDPLYTGESIDSISDEDAADAAALRDLKRTWKSASRKVRREFREWIDARL